MGIDAAADGSGTVAVTASLDAEAATQLGDPAQPSFEDLATAGWTVGAGRGGRRRGLRIRVAAADSPRPTSWPPSWTRSAAPTACSGTWAWT